MNNIKIQFNDLKPYFQKYRKSFHNGLNKLLDEGDYILGKQVELLENKLSSYLVSLNNTSSAEIQEAPEFNPSTEEEDDLPF